MTRRPQAYIGTSGYTYGHWGGGVFYPADVPQRDWLEYYAHHFCTVELNVTFYRLPERSVFTRWRTRTPGRFAFALKGSRYITHLKRLKYCEVPLGLFFTNASGLGQKLRVVLWQLPPMMKADVGRLADFCASLRSSAPARRIRHAFEFRHPTWFCEEVYACLRENNHALCMAHSPYWTLGDVTTADFTYLRFHGGERLYGSTYSDTELDAWASRIEGWLREGKDVYTYFNNDASGFAVRNALRLRELIR